MPPVPPDNTEAIASVNYTTSPSASSKSKKTYNRKDLDELVGNGQNVIIFENKVLDVSKWMNYHPGGALSLSHLAGKDATDYIIAFHPKSVINKQVPRFVIGDYDASLDVVSPKDAKVIKKFKELRDKLEADGLYEPEPNYFNFLLARYTLVFVGSIASCLYLPYMLNAIVGGILMAATWQQVAFYCHDSGHSGVTHKRESDYTLGTVLASFVGGLSMGWWKDSHNVHHIITNNPHHDPDIQHLPVFACTTKFFESLWSTYHGRDMPFDIACKWIIPYQNHLFFLINAFARFLLYGLSWAFVLRGHKQEARKWRALEFVGMITFLTWYTWLSCSLGSVAEGIVFVLVSHVAASILHVQITISHYAMDTADVECEEHFAVKALRTTMDVDCPEWFDWFHGGLQFQIIHHLFPRAPRHNLRKIQPLVIEFAQECGLNYEIYTFSKSTGMVIDQLKVVADHCTLLLKAAAKEIQHL